MLANSPLPARLPTIILSIASEIDDKLPFDIDGKLKMLRAKDGRKKEANDGKEKCYL